jgi:hypothetical protein
MMMMSAIERASSAGTVSTAGDDITDTIVSAWGANVNPVSPSATDRVLARIVKPAPRVATVREIDALPSVVSHVHNPVDERWTTEKVLGMTGFLGG